jgi:hypothetical protein
MAFVYQRADGTFEHLTTNEVKCFQSAMDWVHLGDVTSAVKIDGKKFYLLPYESTLERFEILLSHLRDKKKQWTMKDRRIGEIIVTFGECVTAALANGFPLRYFIPRMASFESLRSFQKLVRDFPIDELGKIGLISPEILSKFDVSQESKKVYIRAYFYLLWDAVDDDLIENPVKIYENYGQYNLLTAKDTETQGELLHCLRCYLPVASFHQIESFLKLHKMLLLENGEVDWKWVLCRGYRGKLKLFVWNRFLETKITSFPDELFAEVCQEEDSSIFKEYPILSLLRWPWQTTDKSVVIFFPLSVNIQIIKHSPAKLFPISKILSISKTEPRLADALMSKSPEVEGISYYLVKTGRLTCSTQDF